MRKKSPYKDKNGKTICHGDIIEFYFDADYPEKTKPTKNFPLTKMVDVVEYCDHNWVCWCELGSGAYLWRYNDRCEVIGRTDTKKGRKILEKNGWKLSA